MKDCSYWDEDDEKVVVEKIFEFECPDCDANNPYPDGLMPGEEVRCFYCGNEYRIEKKEGGKLKFRVL